MTLNTTILFLSKTIQLRVCSVQFSSIPWLTGLLGTHGGWFSRDPLSVFSAGGPCEQFWYRQGCPLWCCPCSIFSADYGVLQGVLKHSFGEAVMVCDMPEQCKFPSLDSCQKRFPWTHKEVDLTPHPVVGLVLQVRDAEKCPHHLVSKAGFLFSEPVSWVYVWQP